MKHHPLSCVTTLFTAFLGSANAAGQEATAPDLAEQSPIKTSDAGTYELIQLGNVCFEQGLYDEALAHYTTAAERGDERYAPALLHNRAAANYKLGNKDEARELWVRALPLGDAEFEAQARYNLGNCDYDEALRMLEGGADPAAQGGVDANRVMQALDTAIEQYRDAVRLDPSLNQARANLELARQFKKQLKEQMEQQQQQSSQPSDEQSETQPSDEQCENPSGDSQQQNADSQQQSSTQPSDQQQQQDQQQSEQEQREGQQEQQDQQQQEQQSSETQPADQQPTETQPAGQPQEQMGEGEQQDQQAQPILLTREEAERLLQMIRDAERARREALRARERGRHEPVDRDW